MVAAGIIRGVPQPGPAATVGGRATTGQAIITMPATPFFMAGCYRWAWGIHFLRAPIISASKRAAAPRRLVTLLSAGASGMGLPFQSGFSLTLAAAWAPTPCLGAKRRIIVWKSLTIRRAGNSG